MPSKFRDLGFPIRSAVQTSPRNEDYNCISWAAGENDRFWWPRPGESYYWPPGIPRELTKAAFVAAFETLGYRECPLLLLSPVDPEVLEFVVFYQAGDEVRHAARQLPSGRWTSKMGPDMDISHDLPELVSKGYGSLGWMMSRPRK